MRDAGKSTFQAAPTWVDLVEQARSITEELFVQRHPEEFLILEHLGHVDSASLPNRTVTVQAVRAGQPRAVLDVMPVQKRDRNNPFSSMITIGRAASSDVVLNDASVSKLHAWIRRANDTLGGTTATVTDSGSTNGTYVNGSPVDAETVPLPLGARLRVGGVGLQFVDARLLHRALVRLPSPAQQPTV